MRATEASEVNDKSNQPTPVHIAAPLELYDRADAPLGQRLCTAREQRGWSRSDVAARLRLPVKLIARLETDDYEGLTQGVFLRGYLGSYARLVGVPPEQVARVAAAHTTPAPLVATGAISRSRYLLERYSVSATYLVLTAIIVVPAVWLATHGGLEQNLARTTTLDPPPALATTHDAASSSVDHASELAAEHSATSAPAMDSGSAPVPPAAVDQAPVIASMTPFPIMPSVQNPPDPAARDAGSARAHTVNLKLAAQSWVDIATADGRKLEYGILAAGTEHTYHNVGPLTVRLGNVQGAELYTDGKAVDLGSFQRGNVAHLTLFGAADGDARHADQ